MRVQKSDVLILNSDVGHILNSDAGHRKQRSLILDVGEASTSTSTRKMELGDVIKGNIKLFSARGETRSRSPAGQFPAM